MPETRGQTLAVCEAGVTATGCSSALEIVPIHVHYYFHNFEKNQIAKEQDFLTCDSFSVLRNLFPRTRNPH